MYDITNYDSFADLEDWYRLVQATFATHDMPYVALVGNKSTLLGVYVLPRACCLTRNVFAADLLLCFPQLKCFLQKLETAF